MMKLLFVLPEYLPHSGGGIVTFYQHALPELVRQGHQVKVLVGSAFTAKLPDYEADGVAVEFLDDRAVTANLPKFDRYRAIPEFQRHLAAAWTAWEQVNRGEGFDLVETTDWGLLFVPWIVKSSIPVVVQLHASIGQIDFYDPRRGDELQGNLTRLLEVELLSIADELQANSQLNAFAWSELTNREVVYIPPAWSPSANIASQSNLSPNGLVVGRVQYWKGPTVLCEALRHLGDSAPQINWIGRDSSYRENGGLMSAYLAQKYPDIWGNKLRAIGALSQTETALAQSNAAFAIVPSIWDVFNYTCIEAMGYGRVVLCSQGAGAAGLITDKVNGLVFESNDPKSLADKLNYVRNMSIEERQQMGEKAKETIEKTLDPVTVVKARIAAYQKAIARGKFPKSPCSWLLNAVSPQKPVERSLAFLDNLPLKDIVRYAFDRSLKKIKR
jgi:glycosyltransferase involved in cell wall biosynthesis